MPRWLNVLFIVSLRDAVCVHAQFTHILSHVSSVKASASVLAALDTSKGMVTITPDMAANAAKLDQGAGCIPLMLCRSSI